MNKTVIVATSIIASAFMVVSYWYMDVLRNISTERKPMDKFTTCIQTVMSESRQNNKPIEAGEAKDICIKVEKI